MKFSEYRAACMRTAGDISHEVIALGLCGEAGEVADLVKKHIGHGHPLDRDKLIEELGDLLWYVAVKREELLEGDLDSIKPSKPTGLSLPYCVLELCDEANELGSDRNEYAKYILSQICRLALRVDSSLNEVAERNIEKLKKRYPDGFSTERSMNREQSNG